MRLLAGSNIAEPIVPAMQSRRFVAPNARTLRVGVLAMPALVLLATSLGGAIARPSPALATQSSAPLAIDNPCAARLSQDAGSRPARAADRRPAKGDGFGTDNRDASDLLWPSRLAARTRRLSADVRPAASQDVGDI